MCEWDNNISSLSALSEGQARPELSESEGTTANVLYSLPEVEFMLSRFSFTNSNKNYIISLESHNFRTVLRLLIQRTVKVLRSSPLFLDLIENRVFDEFIKLWSRIFRGNIPKAAILHDQINLMGQI